ncbi:MULTISPECIES: hypothetical protein [unclassified Streptomyces]|uniref:hypothetical protein n=1 Tax=unclassified Streptomyces TaxID=2593676 RepID=UPI0033258759
MFHNGESFVFDLGIPIVTILALESTPQGSMHPAINFPPTERGRFEIEPSHIAQQQVTVFTLLVDGEERAPHCLRKPLVDVQVVPEAPGAVADRAIDLFLEMYGPRSRSAAQRP